MTSRSSKSLAKQIPFRLLFGFFTLIALVGPSDLVRQVEAGDVEVLSTFATNNVVVSGQFAFAAAGPQGIVIVDLSVPQVAGVVAPVGGTGSIDDVSIDGDLLFALDASGIGGLSVFSIANPAQPVLVSGPVSVCLLYTSPSPRDQRGSRMPSSA